MNVKLAKLFVEKGYLSLDNLKIAVGEQKNNNKSLGEILITKGFITESQLVDLTNLDNQFSTVDLMKIDIPDDVIKSIPKDTVVDNNLVPFGLDGTFLNVAMIDPTNLVLIDELRFLTGYNINPYITEFSNIKNALIKYYDVQSDVVGQKVEAEDKSEAKVGFDTSQPLPKQQDQLESLNKGEVQNSAEPKKEIKQEVKPEISDSQDKEKQESTPNEIIDVFARDTDVVSDRVQTAKSSFKDMSLQSSDNAANIFQAPQQEIADAKSAASELGNQNTFQAPKEKGETLDGFQATEDSKAELYKEPDSSVAKDSDDQSKVFASGNNQVSLSDSTDDKTIELNVEAEDATESNEITDVFSIPPQDKDYSVENKDLSPKTDLKTSEDAESSGFSAETKQTADVFTIPEQDNSAYTENKSLNAETDLRSLKEDSSYDNIESFSKNIDNKNGNQIRTATVDNEALKADLKGIEPVESDLKEAEKPSENESVIPIRETAAKPTVLVVDDSPTVQKIVSVTLSRQGYKVEVSSNAMQALAKLNDFIPDIIFLDINLPHMDGYQLCKIIKGNDLTKEVPVVMLSGKDGFFDKMRGKMVGATDYITKPFEPDTLVTAIKKQGITTSGVYVNEN